jgi:hypothetical protein
VVWKALGPASSLDLERAASMADEGGVSAGAVEKPEIEEEAIP